MQLTVGSLALLRKHSGLTQTALAKKLGVRRGKIAHVEQGLLDPKLSLICKWVEACKGQASLHRVRACPNCRSDLVSMETFDIFSTCPSCRWPKEDE